MFKNAQTPAGEQGQSKSSQQPVNYPALDSLSSPISQKTDPADGSAVGLLLLGLIQSSLPPRQRRDGWLLVEVLAGRYIAAKHGQGVAA